MIVIADTSPLHYLILLEHAEVLQHLYGGVIIPEAVVRELQAQKTHQSLYDSGSQALRHGCKYGQSRCPQIQRGRT